VETVLWALVAFEALTDIKINYTKTYLIPMNLSGTEANSYATMLGCKLSSFPLKYLGVPLNERKVRNYDWNILLDKVAAMLPKWKGFLLSLGGRHTPQFSIISCVIVYAFFI
jgi:hypothetical protein